MTESPFTNKLTHTCKFSHHYQASYKWTSSPPSSSQSSTGKWVSKLGFMPSQPVRLYQGQSTGKLTYTCKSLWSTIQIHIIFFLSSFLTITIYKLTYTCTSSRRCAASFLVDTDRWSPSHRHSQHTPCCTWLFHRDCHHLKSTDQISLK